MSSVLIPTFKRSKKYRKSFYTGNKCFQNKIRVEPNLLIFISTPSTNFLELKNIEFLPGLFFFHSVLLQVIVNVECFLVALVLIVMQLRINIVCASVPFSSLPCSFQVNLAK